MRNRVVEALAAVIGVALVATWYLDRQPAATAPTAAEAPRAVGILREVAEDAQAPALSPPVPGGVAVEVPAGETPAVDPAFENAHAALVTARAAVADVRGHLERLDVQFDAKDEEFARLEAEGMDPDELDEQMLRFLDGIVEAYDELETRLAAAEAAEAAAAARLEALEGSRS